MRGGTPADLRAILDPTGDAALMVANWAPVHLLAHALEWKLFGAWVQAYHAANAALHALVSLLLVALLARSGVTRRAAALGGAFFLVHPANVEAVAWISQLKTLLALAFLLGALLLRERRPLAASLAFALALLSKALAVVALPVAWALDRARPAGTGPGARTLWAWAVLLALFAGAELVAFLYHHPGGAATPVPLPERIAAATAIGARYLAMAATGYGVSTFHEPPPVVSPFDPWLLAGLAAAVLLGARTFAALRRRRIEAAFWLFAAGSYLPVSQLFPFLYPMADRYLYFILPGLLGGCLLAGHAALGRLAPRSRVAAGRAAAIAAAAACVAFAAESHGRAALWVSEARIMADSVRRYPDSALAHYVRAGAAAELRDAGRAVAELREAARSPAFGFVHVRRDPRFAPIRGGSEFQALLRELAQAHVARHDAAERLTGNDLLGLAEAQIEIGDVAGATATLERAVAEQSGYRDAAAALLARLRAQGTP